VTRIIMLAGKGGVGKTSVAAATGLGCAREGYRTLIVSFDLAHSIRDALGTDDRLVAQRGAQPVEGVANLSYQEIDIYEELGRQWRPIYRYVAGLMNHGGLDSALSDELAVLPGTEDIVALVSLHEHLQSGDYDVIVLDCPPTGETLRFIGLASWMQAYAEKRLKRERRLVNLIRPIAKLASDAALYLPQDDFFAALHDIVERLMFVEARLRDPGSTTARLVTIPEKMVVRETQRAHMYLNMYGVHIDLVAVNRMLPVEDPYFVELVRSQNAYRCILLESFCGVPVVSIPLFPEELCGIEALQKLAGYLYGGRDPARVLHQSSPIVFGEEAGGVKTVEIDLPRVESQQIRLSRSGDDFVLQIGNFKRIMQVPWNLHDFTRKDATFENGKLVVRFFRSN
jgi:arsenite-transporting ATPase